MFKKNKEKTPKKHNPGWVSQRDMWAWQSRDISRSIVILFAGFLMVYCTDTLHMPAAIVSAIMVLSKICDGFGNAFAGFIVDNTHTKWGKARPYEVLIVGLWLANWLLFSTPESFSLVAKSIWVFIMYTLVNAVFYPILYASNTVYIVRVFNKDQIATVQSIGGVILMLAAVIFNVAFPMMMKVFATSAAGWSKLALMWAVPMIILGLCRMIFLPERLDVETKAEKQKKLNWKDVWQVLKHNKYIWVACLCGLLFNFVTSMGVQVYYFKYIAHNVGIMGVVSLSNIIILPLAFLFPRWIKKFSTSKLMMVGFVVSAAGYLVNFFAGANVPMLMIGQILIGAGNVPFSMLFMLIVLECADYNEWKGMARMEGTMSSLNGLLNMVGAALGSAGLGVILQAVGYTGSAATNSSASLMMIRLLFSLVPMALYLIVAISLASYSKLDKQMPQIRKDLAARRAAAKENETPAADANN